MMTWKECGNCLYRDKVQNRKTKCPFCGDSMYKTLTKEFHQSKMKVGFVIPKLNK